jgi:hypothetical protein
VLAANHRRLIGHQDLPVALPCHYVIAGADQNGRSPDMSVTLACGAKGWPSGFGLDGFRLPIPGGSARNVAMDNPSDQRPWPCPSMC